MLALAGCATSEAAPTAAGGKVVLLIPGTTGDGGFMDSAAKGVEEGATQVGWSFQVVEAGHEPTKWDPALGDVVSGDADLIITGTSSMKEAVAAAAQQYPEKSFVLFADAITPDECGGCTNIYSITDRTDEAGFISGAVSALIVTDGTVEKTGGGQSVGVVGGQDIPVISNYIEGFQAGAAAIDPNVTVIAAYAGSFSDPVKGKAVADDMIAQGAEIIAAYAGGTDIGVFEAAAEAGIWAIGNSEQQAMNPDVGGVPTVLTSAVDADYARALVQAIRLASDGGLPSAAVQLSVGEGSIYLVDSELFQDVIPERVRARLATLLDLVANDMHDDVLPGL
jgi:basic membrane protein A